MDSTWRPGRRGGNPIEFALTFPVVVLLLFTLFDYGWYFMHKAVAEIAVAEGCRAGAILDRLDGDPDAEAMDTMVGWSVIVIDDCEEEGYCQVSDIGFVPTRRIVCEITMPFEPLVGMVPVPADIHSYSMSRLEWQRAR